MLLPLSLPVLVLAGTIAGTSQSHAGSIVHVDDDAAAGGDGSSWSTACRFLHDAISLASNPVNGASEIRVAGGTYFPDLSEAFPQGTFDRRTSFHLVEGVAWRGGYAGLAAEPGEDPDVRDLAAHPSILSGDLLGNDGPGFTGNEDNVYHVVTNANPAITNTTILDGFTVTAGNADGTLANKTDQGPGVHNHNGMPDFTGRPLLQNCTIVGNWADNHGAVNDHGGMTIVDCEFRDNYARFWGGGLYIHTALETVVTDCRFIDNVTEGAAGGGGAVANEGRSTFTGCVFSGNVSGRRGGGVYNHGEAQPRFVECVFVDNRTDGGTTGAGGGMYNNEIDAVLIRCRFESNISSFKGGALYNAVNRTVVIDSTFDLNWGVQGGAVYNQAGSPRLIGCRFSGNNSRGIASAVYNIVASPEIINCIFDANTGQAGTIYNYNSLPLIANCTIFGNASSASDRAGILNSGSDGSHPTIVNSIIWLNGDGTQSAQIFLGEPSTVDLEYSCVQQWDAFLGGVGNHGEDPLLLPGSDLQLSAGSPCIDAGRNWGVPRDTLDLDADGDVNELIPFDASGAPRFADDLQTDDLGCGVPVVVDMGALEFSGVASPVTFADLDGDGAVGIYELLAVLVAWGPCDDGCCLADIDRNHAVDFGDLLVVLAQWADA